MSRLFHAETLHTELDDTGARRTLQGVVNPQAQARLAWRTVFVVLDDLACGCGLNELKSQSASHAPMTPRLATCHFTSKRLTIFGQDVKEQLDLGH